MATITKAHKGMRLRHVDSGEVIIVDSVFRNPTNGFAGNRTAPFASVIENGKHAFFRLSEIEGDDYEVIPNES